MQNHFKKIRNYFGVGKSNVRLIFPHVPKCGGTSVIQALKKGAKEAGKLLDIDHLNASICDRLAQGNVVDWLNISLDVFSYKCLLSKSNLIVGHAPLPKSTREDINSTTKVVTLLREPVDRWISNYVYDRYKISGTGSHDLRIEDYIESEKGKINGQYYAHFFASKNHQSPDRLIKEAISNLSSFDLVGFTSEMNSFFVELENLIDFPVELEKINTSPKPEASEFIRSNQSLMKKINSICEIDIQIYQQCQEVWNRPK